MQEHLDAWLDFIGAWRGKFRTISRHCHGEHGVGDIEAESWLLAGELRERGIEPRFGDADYADLLLGRLYNRLVKYSEKNVRHGVRLDDDGGEGHSPLLERLSGAEEDDPLAALLASEAAATEPDRDADIAPGASLASAYLQLLRQCGQRVDALAAFLLISPSWCYRRLQRARDPVRLPILLPDRAGKPH